jgi:U4/U6 small nuclear ribonucleoprotein PRP3
MRVMGEQAIADPTAVEQLVESQIKERHDKHLEANEERKLTKEERVEKLTQNQQKDAAKSLHMCVFKIDSLAYGKHRYQIDINAREFALTGVVIMNPRFSLVIAEGGSFSIEKYKKLLLSRMKWTDNGFPTERQMELQKPNEPTWIKPTDEQGVIKDHSSNRCVCVFEGEIKDRLYKKWGSKMCETVGEAKELLARTKLESLWAMAEHTT